MIRHMHTTMLRPGLHVLLRPLMIDVYTTTVHTAPAYLMVWMNFGNPSNALQAAGGILCGRGGGCYKLLLLQLGSICTVCALVAVSGYQRLQSMMVFRFWAGRRSAARVGGHVYVPHSLTSGIGNVSGNMAPLRGLVNLYVKARVVSHNLSTRTVVQLLSSAAVGRTVAVVSWCTSIGDALQLEQAPSCGMQSD
jgi:hypothetical protein